jgi:hypothetical protein
MPSRRRPVFHSAYSTVSGTIAQGERYTSPARTDEREKDDGERRARFGEEEDGRESAAIIPMPRL